MEIRWTVSFFFLYIVSNASAITLVSNDTLIVTLQKHLFTEGIIMSASQNGFRNGS